MPAVPVTRAMVGTMRWTGLLLSAVVACSTATDTGDGLVPTPQDRDGDGVQNTDDCEPDNATVAPGLADPCDGVDNDCDGEVDEEADAFTVYRDQDGDGYGDPATTEQDCAVRAGWTLDATDCGATDPDIYPGAPEYCDEKDHDCDGVTLEGDSLDMVLWWNDLDGDGFGSGLPGLACVPTAGQVGNGDDCDDTRSDVSPRAPEVCDPLNVDEDCDLLPDDLDDWVAGGTQWYPDMDGDGWGAPVEPVWTCDPPQDYVATTLDCDDADPLTHPDAIEVCDGKDDDCDGTVDVDATDASTWYLDLDADGWGEDGVTVDACDLPAGYAQYGGDCEDHNNTIHPGVDESVACDTGQDLNCDGFTGTTDHDGDGLAACDECDDGDPDAHPGATEVCNDKDDDCDGTIDVNAVDGTLWYADADSDGVGDAASAMNACDEPPGFVADSTDCDDTARSTYPGAPENCATAADDSCDGVTNEVDAIACTDWYYDADGDGYGGASVCACDAYGIYTLALGDDCSDVDTAIYPGALEVCGDSIDQDCDGLDDGCTFTDGDGILIGRDSLGAFGSSVGGVGDVDGDGLDDLAIGGIDEPNLVPVASGAVMVVSGPTTGSITVNRPYAYLYGETFGDDAGAAVSGPMDLDGDGVPELLIGAPGHDTAARNSGRVYLAELTAGLGELATVSLWQADGLYDYDELGSSVLLGADLDNDHRKEAVLGAPGNDDEGAESGAVYLFEMPLAGGVDVSAAAVTIRGDVHDRLAVLPPRAADVDGDGVDDLVVGGWGMEGDDHVTGGVAVFLGPIRSDRYVASADAIFRGEATDDLTGSVLDVRDIDGDGTADLLTGGPGSDSTGVDAGAAYLVLGPLDTTGSLSAADAVMYGEDPGDALGTGVAGVDLLGTTPSAVLLGAPGRDTGGSGTGTVYRFNHLSAGTFSAADADAHYDGANVDAATGGSIVNIGDTDGDGYDDAGITATGYLDGTGLVVGAVYVL